MYIPIIKTGEAEIKAIGQFTPWMVERIMPIIELTRCRQKTTKVGNDKVVSFPYENRMKIAKEIFNGRTVFLDLTNDEGLLSNEVFNLYNPNNGYERWRQFVSESIGAEGFKGVIPAILFNWEDEEFERNFKLQVEGLGNACGAVMYRTTIQTKDCYDELPLILEYLPEDSKLWIVLDCGYLQESAVELAYNRCKKRIQNIKNSILKGKQAFFVVAATSYPERVFDYGEGNPIEIVHSEVKLHEALLTDYPDIIYGDYAGTNPIRKDMVIMARGWIPRVDLSLVEKTKVYWKRRPKGVTEYRSTYCRVAQEVINDLEFPFGLRGEWGIEEIISAADGYVKSSVPAFWISVRMNNHILQQLRRLESIRR